MSFWTNIDEITAKIERTIGSREKYSLQPNIFNLFDSYLRTARINILLCASMQACHGCSDPLRDSKLCGLSYAERRKWRIPGFGSCLGKLSRSLDSARDTKLSPACLGISWKLCKRARLLESFGESSGAQWAKSRVQWSKVCIVWVSEDKLSFQQQRNVLR